jgi:hypothetical protein
MKTEIYHYMRGASTEEYVPPSQTSANNNQSAYEDADEDADEVDSEVDMEENNSGAKDASEDASSSVEDVLEEDIKEDDEEAVDLNALIPDIVENDIPVATEVETMNKGMSDI